MDDSGRRPMSPMAMSMSPGRGRALSPPGSTVGGGMRAMSPKPYDGAGSFMRSGAAKSGLGPAGMGGMGSPRG